MFIKVTTHPCGDRIVTVFINNPDPIGVRRSGYIGSLGPVRGKAYDGHNFYYAMKDDKSSWDGGDSDDGMRRTYDSCGWVTNLTLKH